MFSPWYTHRIFKACTGISPADYIRKLRLSKSALRLRDETMKARKCLLARPPIGYTETAGSAW